MKLEVDFLFIFDIEDVQASVCQFRLKEYVYEMRNGKMRSFKEIMM